MKNPHSQKFLLRHQRLILGWKTSLSLPHSLSEELWPVLSCLVTDNPHISPVCHTITAFIFPLLPPFVGSFKATISDNFREKREGTAMVREKHHNGIESAAAYDASHVS
ncbi:hypothetical protein L1887_17184 [Cichorium endivia]|nr:hypothetical protein L1887_17184 [Cichorium endivia]